MARRWRRRRRQAGVPLAFEAAVAGGIPVIKALREGLAGNRISRVAGILNGTCNYILTVMRERGREFAEVLAEAQKLGYAEADPSLRHRRHRCGAQAGDPGGAGVRPAGGVRRGACRGHPARLGAGYRLRRASSATASSCWASRGGPRRGSRRGCIRAWCRRTSPLARVDGVFNAVVAEGDFVGRVMLEGAGRRRRADRSAVVADLIDIARGRGDAGVGGATERAVRRAVGADGGACRGRITCG